MISHIVSVLTISAQPMHNAIQHQLHILVNVKMVILEVDFHVFQQTVQQELFNLVKLVSVINVPIVNHDLHATMKRQVHGVPYTISNMQVQRRMVWKWKTLLAKEKCSKK